MLGRHDLDEMLAEREKLNADIQRNPRPAARRVGIKVANVESEHVDLNDTMVHAMAPPAEAERTTRQGHTRGGQLQAAQTLTQAARILSEHPQALATAVS